MASHAESKKIYFAVFALLLLLTLTTVEVARFEHEHPGERVEVSFGGSQVLRAQIEQGAPALLVDQYTRLRLA